MSVSAVIDIAKETFSDWSEDKASRLAAALSYYTIFSLAPLLLIAISVAGLVFGEEAARGEVVGQIRGMVGQEGGEAIETMIENTRQTESGVLATIVGLGTLLLGASGVFGQLQDALNTIWEVKPKPGRGILGIIQSRFFSFTMVLGTGFLLLVALLVSAMLAAFGTAVGGVLPLPEIVLQLFNLVVSFLVVTLMFALIFKIVPDVEIAWKDVWIGAALTALLFTIGKFLIGFYLGQSSTTSTYGAAGSLVVILLWVYYSAQILFLGAEFTQVYARKYGSRIKPSADAVPVTQEARAQQGMEANKGVSTGAGEGNETGNNPSQALSSTMPVQAGVSRSGPNAQSGVVESTTDGRSFGELIASLPRGLGTLVRQELWLLQVELREKLTSIAMNAGIAGGGVFLGYAGLLALVSALIIWLASLAPGWLAALGAGLLLAAAGYLIMLKGWDKFKS